MYRLAKRSLDLCCVSLGIILFGPPALLIAFLIWLEDRDEVLFTQQRLGREKKVFHIYKFRTMQQGQITRVGSYLRGFGLDEVPQLLNVLRGDISIVGPRPLTQYDIDRLGWNTTEFDKRWQVNPGLTGLAQIWGGRGASHSRRLDNLYLDRRGFWHDVEIIAVSFLMNLFGKRRVRHTLHQARRVLRSLRSSVRKRR